MEFIPYTQALELKQLDFNEPCWAWYNIPDEDVRYCYSEGRSPITNIQEEWNAKIDNKPVENIGLPTFSQAFRWFRDNYDLQGYIYSTTVRGNKDGKHFSDYCWNINGIDMPFIKTDARDMESVTYEQAELACLERLIKIVKEYGK